MFSCPVPRSSPPQPQPSPLQVAQFTVTKERMTEFSMVYYNNLLSIGPVLLLMALFGEFQVRGWL